jgi:hypothetical protein
VVLLPFALGYRQIAFGHLRGVSHRNHYGQHQHDLLNKTISHEKEMNGRPSVN